MTAIRTAFGTLERVAPDLGARWAERLWLSVPPYRGKTRPGVLPRGEEFTVRVKDRKVVGTAWGTGPVVYLVHGRGGVASSCTRSSRRCSRPGTGWSRSTRCRTARRTPVS